MIQPPFLIGSMCLRWGTLKWPFEWGRMMSIQYYPVDLGVFKQSHILMQKK